LPRRSLARRRVLHTGEGPLGYRNNIGIPADQAKALVNELL
jgi:hypothetical protein